MPERIRIAQMVYSFHIESGGGGVTRAAIDIAQNLDPHKFDVYVLGLGYTGSQAEKMWLEHLKRNNVRVFTAASWDEKHPYRSFYGAYRSLSGFFSRQTTDIVHSHSEFTDIAAVLLKLQKIVPIAIRTTHYGYAAEWRTKPVRRALLTNFLYPILFNLEVGVNPTMRDRLNQRFIARLLKRESLFINEAIQLQRFRGMKVDVDEKKHSLGIPTDAPLIGCVGRLAEQKGHSYLLQAAAMVIQSEPHTFFLIIGDGPLAGELKNQARQLGIQNNVVFTGSRSDVEELLACLDLYAMASLWEGMPISVLESMASQVPVVTTDIAGSHDLIPHGVNGWLVPPADYEAMAQAICDLMASRPLRNSLTKSADDTVKQYSIDAVTNRYENLYLTLIQKNHR
jgi:glycosyltransferase involved in cell wall biosynthesis